MNKVLRFEITDRCNLRCWMCWSTNWKHLDMTYTEIERIILNYKKEQGKTVVLTSREPLLSPNIKDVLDLCKREKLNVKLLTNGTLISDKMAKYLVDLDIISFVAVSIHGMSSIHDSVTHVSGSWERAITGIKNIQKYKKMTHRVFPEVRITSVVSTSLLNDIDNIIDMAENTGCQLRIQHFMWHPQISKKRHKAFLFDKYGFKDDLIDGFSSECSVDADYVIERLEYAKKKSGSLGIDLQIYPKLNYDEITIWYGSSSIEVFKKARCRHVMNSIRLRANGNVTLCQYIDLSLGNFKDDSFYKIINNSMYHEISNVLLNGGIFPICNRCCHIESFATEEDSISNALI